MMVELAPISAQSSRTVRTEYRDHLDLLVLHEYDALTDALATGGLVPLPPHADRFNLRPRTEGPAPIAEKDLARQATYVSARPATIGALLEIAAQVKSGPLEITSLVRHSEYQDALRTTNGNANTSVPMHTMGLAVDIALINSSLETVYEIRDVLRRMQQAGDILFIGERRQLVFHVVPHPSRLGRFSDTYARALQGLPIARTGTPIGARAVMPLVPMVSAEVIALHPTSAHAAEWWAADASRSDLLVAVSAPGAPALAGERRGLLGRLFSRIARTVGRLVDGAGGVFR